MNINFNYVFKLIIPYVSLMVGAYFVSTVIFYILPKTGVSFVNKNWDDMKYTNYNLNNVLEVSQKQSQTLSVKEKEYELLSNLTLNAVYAKNDGTGWIIIKENATSKTHILKNTESFKNYVLKLLFPSYVIFEKNGKEYKLSIKQSGKKFEIITKKSKDSKWNEKIIFDGDNVSVKRKYLDSYVNNIEKVWKDIQITEVKSNGFISGFKVSNIIQGSMFDKLGLKTGDIITKVNNIKINNYSKAFNIYKNMKNIKYLNIEILRNSRQMELKYEIN